MIASVTEARSTEGGDILSPRYSRELEKLQQKVESLQSLIDISSIINSTLNLDELLELSMSLARKVMRAEAASLMLLNERKEELHFKIALGEVGEKLISRLIVPVGQGIAGTVAKTREPLIINDVQSDPRFFKKPDSVTGFVTKSMLCVPLLCRDQIIGVSQVINRTIPEPFTQDDLSLFMTFSSQVANAIENARLHSSLLEKQKLDQELETAAIIQKGFLPQKYPDSKKIEMYARHISAKQVSGDFYDIIEFSNNQVGVLVGDVSGKGVPAALHMAGFISDFRSLAPVKRDTGELFTTLNRMLCKRMMHGKFITTTYLLMDTDTFFIELLNAGHIPTLHISGESGHIRVIDSRGGPPLGILPDLEYEYERTRFNKGDTFLMFTDGLTETFSPEGEQFSFPGIQGVLERHVDKPLPELIEILIAEIIEFSGTARPDETWHPRDDLTVVAVRFREL